MQKVTMSYVRKRIHVFRNY